MGQISHVPDLDTFSAGATPCHERPQVLIHVNRLTTSLRAHDGMCRGSSSHIPELDGLVPGAAIQLIGVDWVELNRKNFVLMSMWF